MSNEWPSDFNKIYYNFRGEDALLNDFLKRQALFEHIMHQSCTKMIKTNGETIGFFTMAKNSVENLTEHPEFPDAQHSLLDALFALGKVTWSAVYCYNGSKDLVT